MYSKYDPDRPTRISNKTYHRPIRPSNPYRNITISEEDMKTQSDNVMLQMKSYQDKWTNENKDMKTQSYISIL